VPAPPAAPTNANLHACWADLAAADAERAYTAHWQLSAVPTKSVSFLRERVRPADPLDASRREEIGRLIADLDSDKFAVRKQSAQRLTQAGSQVVPLLRDALTKQPTAEAKRLLEQILERLDGLFPS